MSAPCFGPIPGATDHRSAKRRRLEQMIEAAIALLDAVDGDEHLEETGDLEPYLAGSGARDFSYGDDREEDAGDEGEPETDDEPSLGWTGDEAEGGAGYSPFASSHRFLDGEVCAGDEPEYVSEDGESLELYAGVECLAADRPQQEGRA